MEDRELEEIMEDSLNSKDIEVINNLRGIMKIDDDDDALCALYELELYFFNKGLKSATKTVIINYKS